MQARIEKIYAAVLPHMAANGIEDTPENRFYALTGVKQGWLEDEDKSPEKEAFLAAISSEILALTIKLIETRGEFRKLDYVLDYNGDLHWAECKNLDRSAIRTYLSAETVDGALVAPTNARQHTCMNREEQS